MRRLTVTEWMSLDGVIQSPSTPDEDRSNGFSAGGWHPPYFDDAAKQRTLDAIVAASAYVFGRGTYERFAAHWPNASEAEQPVAVPLNERPKYVASTTLTAPLAWHNATLLGADVPAAIAALDGDLLVIGSPLLVRTLLAADLVDELRLMIDPIVVGNGGKRLFDAHGPSRSLRLVDSSVSSTGAIMVTYQAERPA